MRAYVDKVEDGRAELRFGEHEQTAVVVPLKDLPHGTREGDVLRVSFERDEAAASKESEENDALRQALLDRSRQEPF